MNRTLAFVSLAGLLLVAALLLSPKRGGRSFANLSVSAHEPASGKALTLDARITHPWTTGTRTEAYVTLEVRGRNDPVAERRPLHLALVIDRSGSMHGAALAHARAAALRIVARLRPDDRLSVVHYGSDVEVLPSSQMGPTAVERAQAFIRAIHDDGGTNLGGALEAASLELRHSPLPARRVLLLTDGRPTEGVVESDELVQQVRGLRAEGVTLSAIGLGEDYQEDLLQAFADVGGGAYGYLRDAEGLPGLFERELELATTTVAREVDLLLTAGPGVRVERVLGERGAPHEGGAHIRLPDISAGQLERVVVAVTLSGTPEMFGLHPPLTAELRWVDAQQVLPARLSEELALTLTDDPARAEAERDPIAEGLAAQALAAEQVQLAAQDLELGDAATARERLGIGRRLLRAVPPGSDGGPAPLVDQLERHEALIGAAPADRAAAVKELKREAQRGLGRVGSTY